VQHPDKAAANDREAASERFKQITEAYSVLSDPKQRRHYDLLGDPRAGGSYGHHQHPQQREPSFDPFGDRGFAFRGFPQPAAPPRKARRFFHCSLHELDTGCRKKFTLKDGPISRLRDAIDGGWGGPAAQAAWSLGTVAVSVAWRFPSLVFGRPWWLRLPFFAAIYIAVLYQQLPPSPSGVFEINVKPGWHEGTRVVFSRAGQRGVAFHLRQRRHRRLERSKHDLVYRCTVRRHAARGGTTIRVPTTSGEKVEFWLASDTVSDEVCHVLEGQGMPIKGGPTRGDLRVLIQVR